MNSNFLRNIAGEVEIGRLYLSAAGGAAILAPLIFEAVDMCHNGWHFDVVAWCTAYPGGLSTLAGIGLFALGKKEKDVAAAKAINATTAQQVQDTAESAQGGS